MRVHTINAAVIYNGKAVIEPRTERYIHIPMPWKRRMYTPANDDFGIRRPVLGIYWYSRPAGCLNVRIGWTSIDAGQHECRDGVNLGSNAR
jgi:hypothetical protein